MSGTTSTRDVAGSRLIWVIAALQLAPSIAVAGGTIGLGAFFVFLAWAATIFLAAKDHDMVRDAGVVRAFAWAWAFLGPVYLIGRCVAVERERGTGLAPALAWFVATTVADVVVVLIASLS
ncbi:hypothetical protein HQQ81_17445 [Microbacteriaceae bacterium VKM Ac-2854]|nr:hypothetical protein [Microbacteriaceae bacterium VKM Ac-2854]